MKSTKATDQISIGQAKSSITGRHVKWSAKYYADKIIPVAGPLQMGQRPGQQHVPQWWTAAAGTAAHENTADT